MKTQRVEIDSGGLALEGELAEGDVPGVFAVVAHPHPLYGGDMNSSVVLEICRGFREAGAGFLRFNFRGAGKSEGSYDEGRGETEDLRAATGFLKDRGAHRIILSGYSFGAWVALRFGVLGPCFFVAPPIGVMDFTGLEPPGPGSLVVVGENDDLAPPEKLKEWLQGSGAKLELIPGADHFLFGKGKDVELAVGAWAPGVIDTRG